MTTPTPKPPPLQITVDLASPWPVYRQIVDGLRPLLVDRRLRPGDALPTVRRLAVDLGVNHNTVAEAYRLLAEEGWLDLRRGRGALVTERGRPKAAPSEGQRLRGRLDALAAEARAAGLSRSELAAALRALLRRLGEER